MKHKLKIQWLPTKTKWTEGTMIQWLPTKTKWTEGTTVYRWDGRL